MTPIRFTVPGPPVAKARPRFGKGRTYTPTKTRRAERDIGWLAKQAMTGRPIITGPVTILIEAGIPIPIAGRVRPKDRHKAVWRALHPTGRPDADNLAKIICDALNGIVYADDAQVIDLHVQKFYSTAPTTHVTINEVVTP